VINTPIGRQAAHDDRYLRRAPVEAIAALRSEPAGGPAEHPQALEELSGGEKLEAGPGWLAYR
jgi:hypothetical protein